MTASAVPCSASAAQRSASAASSFACLHDRTIGNVEN